MASRRREQPRGPAAASAAVMIAVMEAVEEDTPSVPPDLSERQPHAPSAWIHSLSKNSQLGHRNGMCGMEVGTVPATDANLYKVI